MKKILSALLLAFVMLLSACGGVKYEFKDGVMYGDGKEATGTFEFKAGKYKVKGNFVNGLPDGLFEKYYYGQLMGSFADDEDLKLHYDNGNLIMTYNDKTGESIIYHENGNPLMTVGDTESAIYNENNEMLFKVRNGEAVDIGATLKNLDDGSFELLKDNKVVAKVDRNGEVVNYLYATGETLMKANDVDGATEIFFKDGTTFFKAEGDNFAINYRNGKPLYKLEGDEWKFYNEEGDQIVSNFEIITDIKKID